MPDETRHTVVLKLTFLSLQQPQHEEHESLLFITSLEVRKLNATGEMMKYASVYVVAYVRP